MRISIRALVFVAVILLARSATAQFVQYTAPGSLGERGESLEGHIRQAADAARWSLGPVRLEPWGTLKDISYIDNVFAASSGAEVSDVTGTAGLGLRAYLRSGPKVIWAAHALPEYVWWADQTERRRWNGRYGAGVFAYFNRLKFVARLVQTESQDVVSAEFDQRITSQQLRAHVTTEVDLTAAIGLYADAYSLEISNLTEELNDSRVPDLERLDRRERVINTGVRWRPRRNLSFDLGVESSDVQFDQLAQSRSNSGTAPYFATDWDQGKVYVHLDLSLRDLKPEPDAVATFPAFTQATGSLLVQVNLSDRLQGRFYGRSGLVYALSSDYAYFSDEKLGAGLHVEIGQRLAVGGFVELGTFDYERINPAAMTRQDDVTTLGAEVDFEISESLTLALGVHRTDYDSNFDMFDRKVTVLRSTLGFGADAFPW